IPCPYTTLFRSKLLLICRQPLGVGKTGFPRAIEYAHASRRASAQSGFCQNGRCASSSRKIPESSPIFLPTLCCQWQNRSLLWASTHFHSMERDEAPDRIPFSPSGTSRDCPHRI